MSEQIELENNNLKELIKMLCIILMEHGNLPVILYKGGMTENISNLSIYSRGKDKGKGLQIG